MAVTEPGTMRQRVLVQEATESASEEGGIVREWHTIGQRWCNISPIRGREFWNAQQVQSDVSHRVRMRYDSEITTNHRLVIGREEDGRILNIESVINVDELSAELELLCKEVS